MWERESVWERQEREMEIWEGRYVSVWSFDVWLFFQVHPDIQKEVNIACELQDIPKHLAQLDEMSVRIDYDDDAAMSLLKHIYVSMVNFESQRSNDTSDTTVYTKYTMLVIEQGGIQVMLRLLMSTAILPPSSKYSAGG